MAYVDVHAPNGAHLFTYDPARGLVQIKVKGVGLLTVDLEQYQQQSIQDQAEMGSDECRSSLGLSVLSQ